MAGVVAGAVVYGSAPAMELKEAAKEAVTPTDASHRKDATIACNDEGHHEEHPVAPVRAVGVEGAAAPRQGGYLAGPPSTEDFGAFVGTPSPATFRGYIEMVRRETWRFIRRLLSR